MLKQIFGLTIVALAAPATPTDSSESSVSESVPFFYPEAEFQTFEVKNESSLLPTPVEESVEFGRKKLLEKLGLGDDEFEVVQFNQDEAGVVHIYGVHKINGVRVGNHNAAIHVLNGEVVAESASFNVASSFVDPEVAPAEGTVSLEEAERIASEKFGIPRDDFPATSVYLETEGNKIVLAHQFQLRDDAKEEWIQVSVDASNGNIVQVVDYVDRYSYDVVALPRVDVREGFELVKDPEDATASPSGWSFDGKTIGNNVDSRINSYRASASGSTFDTNWQSDEEPDTSANKDAAIINNFYVSNAIHDILYFYGFDEASGNFQEDNFGKGGSGSDSVMINNQAPGSNNANFATPPDGQNPTMNMFTWTTASPKRDGSLDNSVPIHEYGHGVSNRLTGGGAQTGCLGTTEARGMGEGWSDALAFMFSTKEGATNTDTFALGAYVANKENGIRTYPYSTSMTVNPFTYNSISGSGSVHFIGSVWATMLYDMYWNLIDEHGFSANLYDASQEKGNIMALKVMMGGLKLQPCNPTFKSARDAILSADQTYYGGKNKCLIWKAFAKRGLGTDAGSSTDGFSLPSSCSGTPQPTSTTSATPTAAPTSSCAHDKCVRGVALSTGCDACVDKIIAADSYCGTVYWDGVCVGQVSSVCGLSC